MKYSDPVSQLFSLDYPDEGNVLMVGDILLMI
jgi:hypothetical protein